MFEIFVLSICNIETIFNTYHLNTSVGVAGDRRSGGQLATT